MSALSLPNKLLGDDGVGAPAGNVSLELLTVGNRSVCITL